jgi:hypothetical protein
VCVQYSAPCSEGGQTPVARRCSRARTSTLLGTPGQHSCLLVRRGGLGPSSMAMYVYAAEHAARACVYAHTHTRTHAHTHTRTHTHTHTRTHAHTHTRTHAHTHTRVPLTLCYCGAGCPYHT